MASLTRVARTRKPNLDDRRDEFERTVLSALEQLLSDGTPFTELAVQRIAKASGVARSTFYRYFPDKSQLLIRMADLATEDLFGTAERWWLADHTDARDSVITAMRDMLDGFRNHRVVLLALYEVSAYDRDVGRYWSARVRAFTGVVRTRLHEEQRAGQVSAEVDVDATAIVLTSMVERVITVACAHASTAGDEQIAQALGRAIWLILYGDRA
ncbi:TetR/AcrR family transcriptional regulator [Nocardia callitridis]|uniref:HTH tetR-type domain-containing protein n=1 Tax=Nocardia callitridis TaxID=648753 RepID=A0ABP9KRW8_9NOCA